MAKTKRKKRCEYCHKKFDFKRPTRRFCSDSCRIGWYHRKHRIERHRDVITSRLADLLAYGDMYPDLWPEIANSLDIVFSDLNFARRINPLDRLANEPLSVWLRRVNRAYKQRYRKQSPIANATIKRRPVGLGLELIGNNKNARVFSDEDAAAQTFLHMISSGEWQYDR